MIGLLIIIFHKQNLSGAFNALHLCSGTKAVQRGSQLIRKPALHEVFG